MGRYQMQVIIPNQSNLIQDSAINTFAFAGNDTESAALAWALANISAFYNTNYSAHHVAEYLSPSLNAASATYKWYNLDEPKPRVPVTGTIALTSDSASGNPLPAEVAVVLSFQGTLTSGEVQARRRGRIFLGPLRSTAGTAIAGGDSRPSTECQATLRAAALALASAGTSGTFWGVYSRTNDDVVPITNGWTDDAWDTQRRRGIAPSVRTTWAVP